MPNRNIYPLVTNKSNRYQYSPLCPKTNKDQSKRAFILFQVTEGKVFISCYSLPFGISEEPAF